MADVWWATNMRILDYVYYSQIDTIRCEEIIEQVLRCDANAIHFHCHHHAGGLCEHSIYHKSRCAKKQNRDILGEFLPLAHQYGIKVIVYLNGHWFKKSFADQHPDWWVIKSDGQRHENLYGQDDATFCVNSPFRDWHFRLIEDLLAYDIDGIFFDGPIVFPYLEACNCSSCQEKFKKRYGLSMPKWDKKNASDFQMLIDFMIDSLVDYYKDAYQLIKSIKPHVLMYGNSANVLEAPRIVGRDNRKLLPYIDILGAEGGFISSRTGFEPFKIGASIRLYEEQSDAKPRVVFTSLALGSWRRHTHTPQETQQVLYQSAISAWPYVAYFNGSEEQSGVKSVKNIFGFLKENQSYFQKTRRAADIGLVYSTETLNYYSGVDIPWADMAHQKAVAAEQVGNYTKSFWGFYEMLVRSGLPFNFVDSQSVMDGNLDNYKVLMLGNVACMSQKQCDQLKRFVENGGLLIADFEASHYDQCGKRLENFGLASMFGVDSLNALSDKRPYDYTFALSHEKTDADFLYLPAPEYHLLIKPTTAKVQMVYSQKQISNLTGEIKPSETPFCCQNDYGKGKSVYVAGMLSEYYQRHKTAQYRQLVQRWIEAFSKPLAQIIYPKSLIDLHIRYQPAHKQYILHLVNLDPVNFEQILPVSDIHIQLKINMPFAKAYALHSQKELPIFSAHQSWMINLPVLNLYETIVIE